MAVRETKFEKQCRAVREELDIEWGVVGVEKGKERLFEDDGILHIIKQRRHVWFDVGDNQERSGREQNERTCTVLRALGLAKYIGMVLVYEGEGEDCPLHTCTRCGEEW